MQDALNQLSNPDFREAAFKFFDGLGYQSTKTFDYEPLSFDEFAQALGGGDAIHPERSLSEQWEKVHLLFQFTEDELSGQAAFPVAADHDLYEAFVFIGLELTGEKYSRTQLASIARELNKPFASPVIVLFKHGGAVTLASVARRQNKLQADKHVLQKVSLLKDIQFEKKPHPAHVKILEKLLGAHEGVHNWTEFLHKWNEVLDISELNKQFYTDYKVVFELIEENVELPKASPDTRREWTQRLFNRLLFLRFLERKGWLEYEGDEDYLNALFAASKKAGETDFLNERLFYTFFFGLGFVDEQTHLHSAEKLLAVRGKVPYLNGGLFEQIDESDGMSWASLSNESFAAIFSLFDRYYFTVDESTPLEQEVGIDPEMLGKVFEELVTGRHESGSYYTPRGIVSFMGREALKGYLEQFESPEAVSKLVDEGDGTAVSDPEQILTALREVTICDPACGSGAYLLGMMQELLRLREALFTAKARDYQKIYDRKLEIIAQNLYGVDKDPFAVNIAMLRLWLSLVIEFEGETPPPLPNLKYKIESGDSLAAPLGVQLTLDSEQVKEFNRLKAAYVKAHHQEKTKLQAKIEEVRTELKALSQAPAGAHDWRTEFAEVFENGGFDIVVANPPYIRQELIKDQKPQLKVIFGSNFSGTADLYCYFYLRGHELLKDGGQLSFISPNKWFRAAYGAKLRAHFATNAHVRSIVDFGELPVFQSAATFPMVFISTKSSSRGSTIFTQVKSLAEPYPDVRALVQKDGSQLPETALSGANWSLNETGIAARLETMRKSGLPLGEYVKGRFYRGVVTGLNEAFVIDRATRDTLIAEHQSSVGLLKPWLRGRDVRRWNICPQDLYVCFVGWHTELEKDYPAIYQHLLQFQPDLKKRPEVKTGRVPWYAMSRYAADYQNEFDNPKIIYPVIGKEPRFSFDRENFFFNDKAFMIAVDDLYLLGVLNSLTAWHFLKETCSVLGDADTGGRVELRSIYVERLPVPIPGIKDRNTIEDIVEKCLEKRGKDCSEEEAEINSIVAKLYGLEK